MADRERMDGCLLMFPIVNPVSAKCLYTGEREREREREREKEGVSIYLNECWTKKRKVCN